MEGSSGYSGTPLPKKLGLKHGMTVAVTGFDQDYEALIGSCASELRLCSIPEPSTDLVHCFTVSRSELETTLKKLRTILKPQAVVWVSWPKRSSKVPTDVTEDVIREVALPLGFVDVKVCSVTEIWSGLKLVVRKELR